MIVRVQHGVCNWKGAWVRSCCVSGKESMHRCIWWQGQCKAGCGAACVGAIWTDLTEPSFLPATSSEDGCWGQSRGRGRDVANRAATEETRAYNHT